MKNLTSDTFGSLNGQPIQLYKIEFQGKLKAEVINFGCILKSLEIPDRNGKLEDVVLGYDDLEQYSNDSFYFGAVIGRHCGRITDGEFSIDGEKYNVVKNNGENHLHGGLEGFNKKVWDVETEEKEDSVILKFKYISSDGEENYPGKLTTLVTYTFTENEFKIDYNCKTDKPTIVNLTQHTYFNLSACLENILEHELQLNASKFIPINNLTRPTGQFEKVTNTPFDFSSSKKIGRDIFLESEQLKYGNGYDHSWVIEENPNQRLKYAGKLFHTKSGRCLECYTTMPGILVYTSNFLEGDFKGKNKVKYQKHYGVCLETQFFPNSPNQTNYQIPILRPEETFNSTTLFRFSNI